ncbi:MAG: LysR substrate-binding domain-containing protein, partial [Verrucomicrobiia bacterium]
ATISRNFLMERLHPVLEQRDVEIIQRSAGLGELLAGLASHLLDVVLSNQPVLRDTASAFHTHHLSSQKVSLVGPADRKRGRFRFPNDLEKHPLLLPSQMNATRAAFDLILERHHLHPQILAEVDDMATLRLLAAKGLGLALVPPVVVQMELQNGLLKEWYRFDDLEEHFYAITVSTRFPSNLTALVLQKETG